jgi:hypothetical protein
MAIDPRGPIRKITDINQRSDVTLVTMDCGHTGRMNQIYMYRIGANSRCYECGLIARGLQSPPNRD